jgi:hypothetical protein
MNGGKRIIIPNLIVDDLGTISYTFKGKLYMVNGANFRPMICPSETCGKSGVYKNVSAVVDEHMTLVSLKINNVECRVKYICE